MTGPRERWRRLVEGLRRLGVRIYRVPYLHGVLSTSGDALRGFVRDDCHIMAAAISFYAVLSLLPLMLLMISIAGYVLEYIGQEYASQQALFAHLAEYVRAVFPFTSEDFIQRLRAITMSRETFGVTGLIILFITASLVFRSLELAFARIFKTRRHRSLLGHQLLMIAFILAIGLLFLGIHYLTVVGSSVASGGGLGFATAFQRAMRHYLVLRFAVSLVSGTLVFAVLLKYFSRERVRMRASLLGGMMFALLWIGASKLFGYYLENLARFSMLYGSLATPAVIVVWIFYSACILLLCTEVAKVLQQRYWPLPALASGRYDPLEDDRDDCEPGQGEAPEPEPIGPDPVTTPGSADPGAD